MAAIVEQVRVRTRVHHAVSDFGSDPRRGEVVLILAGELAASVVAFLRERGVELRLEPQSDADDDREKATGESKPEQQAGAAIPKEEG